MQYLFYDTCALLDQGKLVFENKQPFYISTITLKELEYIKSSALKDQEIKYRARQLIELLAQYEAYYTVVLYENKWDTDLKNYSFLPDNNDGRIILSALKLQEQKTSTVNFITTDYFCKRIAAAAGLKVDYVSNNDTPYTGYIEIKTSSNIELEDVYSKIYSSPNTNPFQLLYNQYLLVKDAQNKIIDCYKYNGEAYLRVPDFYVLENKQFGKLKPKDAYQLIAIDSLTHNKITVLRGPAGSGKSYLALSFLFSQYEKGKIDKIIIFCNTVAARGAAKLGYYPGDKNTKLLDSQIGNFLSSKIGDKVEIERLIEDGTIILLPMADLRGYDTTGMKAGVYITEAQNMDIELMRLALQRISDDCICILDGDSDAQVDSALYAGSNNGLKRVSTVFRGQKIYGEVTLPNIYRSQIADIAQKL